MPDTFGTAALRWQAAAAQVLGWRPPDFWSATPTELASCLASPVETPAPLDRAALNTLMEQDDDRSR